MTTTAIETLRQLEAAGYEAVLEGRGLVLKALPDTIDAPPYALLRAIELHKAEIARILQRPRDVVFDLPAEEAASPRDENATAPASPPPADQVDAAPARRTAAPLEPNEAFVARIMGGQFASPPPGPIPDQRPIDSLTQERAVRPVTPPLVRQRGK